jgi:DNA (cytosine-5)-methyltransferase 1
LLYLAVPALAVALDVPIVLIENVPEVLQDRVHAVVPTTTTLLQRAGYVVSHGKLLANELGWPQTRKRYFLVATKTHVPVSLDVIRREWTRPPTGVIWAIDDLLNRAPTSIMDSVPQLADENRQRIDYLFESGEYELPDAIRPDCHKDGHSYPSVYGRLRENDPAGTITTGFLSPGRGRFIHPLRPRVLTPREAARIQGFPDWFDFAVPGAGEPSRRALSKWIGDAVPSILGYVAGLAALGPLP